MDTFSLISKWPNSVILNLTQEAIVLHVSLPRACAVVPLKIPLYLKKEKENSFWSPCEICASESLQPLEISHTDGERSHALLTYLILIHPVKNDVFHYFKMSCSGTCDSGAVGTSCFSCHHKILYASKQQLCTSCTSLILTQKS